MDSAFKQLARRILPRTVRNWLRSPAQAVHWWLNEGRAPIELDIRADWRLRCPRNALDNAFRLQLHDPPQMRELDDFIALVRTQPGTRLLDIGSHFGVFSFAALHYGGSTASALAVDPSVAAESMVRRIAKLNGFADRVRFIRAAAGPAIGEIEMVDAGVSAAGYMVLPGDHPPSERTRLPQTTLDCLAAQMAGLPTVIKIDVESYELEVLRGGQQTLSQHAIPLCLEMHNQMMRERGVDPRQVIELLRTFGYERYACERRAVSGEEILQADIIRIIAVK